MSANAYSRRPETGSERLPAPTDLHAWWAHVAKREEDWLRAHHIYADDVIAVLKPLGHEIFEEGSTVSAHLRRAQTVANRAFALSEMNACVRARIIRIAPEPAR